MLTLLCCMLSTKIVWAGLVLVTVLTESSALPEGREIGGGELDYAEIRSRGMQRWAAHPPHAH